MSLFTLCICLCLSFFSFPQHLQAGESLTWLEVDSPPFYITEGELAGQGYQSKLQNLIEGELPQYYYNTSYANISRHYELFRKKEQVCAVALYKTPEREKIANFSIPSFITFPGVLVIRKETQALLDYKQSVSLKKVVSQGDILLGLSKGRSFGSELDSIIDFYGSDQTIFSYEGKDLNSNLIEMLVRGRIDAMISLPEEVMYHAEKLGLRDKIITLEIEETISNPDGMICYVACSKSPWGQEVIENINEVLLKKRPTAEYRALYERWLDPNAIERYRPLYRKHLLGTTE